MSNVKNTKDARSFTEAIQSTFQEFFQSSSAAGITILVFTAIAMLWVNGPFGDLYHGLLHQPIKVTLATLNLDFTFEHFVNDGLMVIFFLVVGLEIKREILVGELSSARKAALPMIAAVAGMIGPGTIYLLFNYGTDAARGWGVPVATDIAFALGILALLGKRVPLGLKIFLAALAIVDDLLAVLVIAIFYTSTLNMAMLGAAVIILAILFAGNRAGIQSIRFYGVVGFFLWVAVLFSGVHATIAGVLLALTIPSRSRINVDAFTKRIDRLQTKLAQTDRPQHAETDRLDVVHAIEDACESVQSPLHRIEHGLQPWVSFFIMPVFALVNAGIHLNMTMVGHLTSPIALGVALGLFAGKQIGVFTAVWASVRFKIAELPENVTFKQIYGVAILCGIGFTMALFVANLAFNTAEQLDMSKLSIILGSTISAIAGSIWLRMTLPKPSTVPSR